MDINATAVLRVPARNRDAWIFFLNYGSNREFLPHIPIPGFGYSYQPSDQLSAVVTTGFLSLQYRPVETLTLTASYVAVRTVDVRLTYQVFRPIRLWVGFDWTNERYLRAGRANPDDRLFYYEKRIRAGAIIGLARQLFVDVDGRLQLRPVLLRGRELQRHDQNRIDVGDGPFASVPGGREVLTRRSAGSRSSHVASASPMRRWPSRFQCESCANVNWAVSAAEITRALSKHALPAGRARGVEARQHGIGRPGLAAVGHEAVSAAGCHGRGPPAPWLPRGRDGSGGEKPGLTASARCRSSGDTRSIARSGSLASHSGRRRARPPDGHRGRGLRQPEAQPMVEERVVLEPRLPRPRARAGEPRAPIPGSASARWRRSSATSARREPGGGRRRA